MLAVVVACSAGDGERPARGGEHLRLGYDLETMLTRLDPATSNNSCDTNVQAFVFDTLLRVDPDGDVVSGIAREWEIERHDRVVLHLHEGVEYHDGSPLDATSVAAGLERNAQNPNFTTLRNVRDFVVVDDLTLALELDEPAPLPLVYDLTRQSGMLVAPSAFDTVEERPVGAGPFVFESHEPGARIRLRAHDAYFEAEDWALTGLDIVQADVPRPAGIAALLSRDLDVARFLPESLGEVERTERLAHHSRPTDMYVQLQFRLRAGPDGDETAFADPTVRRAVNHAINREEINEVVEAGTGTVASQPFPPDSPFFVEELHDRYPYDPERARSLLAEAGYPDGFSFTMAIPGGGLANAERQAELIQEQLGAVGIDVVIERILPQDIPNDYYLRKIGDAFSAQRPAGAFPPQQLSLQWGAHEFVAIHNGAVHDGITRLADEAATITDDDELAEIVREMSRLAVEDALDVPIAHTAGFVAWDTDRVEGTVGASPDVCRPPDLRGVAIR